MAHLGLSLLALREVVEPHLIPLHKKKKISVMLGAFRKIPTTTAAINQDTKNGLYPPVIAKASPLLCLTEQLAPPNPRAGAGGGLGALWEHRSR